MRRTRVVDVMTTDVATVPADAGFRQIVQMLAERNVSGLPVVDAGLHVIGVVSEADLLPKEAYKDEVRRTRSVRAFLRPRRWWRDRADRRRAAGDTARVLMSTPAITIEPDRTIAEAARLLAGHRIKRLPVVDSRNILVGIVSRADLVGVFLRSDDDIRQEILDEVVVKALWESPSTVEVDVHDGVVTLRGRVEIDTLVPIAAHLAAAVDGVVDVANELDYAHTTPKPRPVPPTPW
ncbi:MAG: CBS domain-containing protein [Streptosporangiales bacterium]|nr:CBS domain-containing protein [Streptosporangiales bacterium]